MPRPASPAIHMGACPGYVIDHVTPLKRGGADSPSNMQWQTREAAKIKDKGDNEIKFNTLDKLFDIAIMLDCSQCPIRPQLKPEMTEPLADAYIKAGNDNNMPAAVMAAAHR